MAVRTAVGLDIGASGVRAAEVTLGKQPATLERFGQVALPPGTVRDGEVIDPDTVARAIKQLWATAKFSTKKVVLGVSNQKVIVRQVDLPFLPPNEMRKSLAFQVQDFIPIPVEEAILDFHPLEEFVNDQGGRMLRVLLVAASRDMVNGAMQAAQSAGLTPVMVDLTPFALLRSLAPVDAQDFDSNGAEALVDVGASVTNIIVHQGGVPRFVRILLMGGNDITEAVAERMGMPIEQAEATKVQLGMSLDLMSEAAQHPAARVIDQYAGQLVDEVRGSLDYYLAQPQAVRLRRVVLSGGGAQLGGLVQRLGQATRMSVEAGQPLANFKLGKLGLSPEQLRFVEPLVAVPVGLAMGVA
ncbi:MAG TPA: type IV pilus assembly protein PilM [Mycobacteriales bacterium]|nr:type IV pilus assembly protein PilM [Mycobacteriales bacterium]